MGWWNDVKNKLNPAQPSIAAEAGGEVSGVNLFDYNTAYKEVEVVYRAVDLIVNACTEIPFLVPSNIGHKQVNKLLNIRPNPFEDRNRLFRRAFLDYMLDGNAFFYYDRETEGKALHVLPANSVSIIPHPKIFVKEYTYTPATTQVDFFGRPTRTIRETKNTEIIFKPEEIIHVKADSEGSVYRGESKLRSVSKLLELYFAMISFQRQFFNNNAIPGFVLSTENVLSEPVKTRLLESWRQSYSTIMKGARSPAILDGGLKIDKFSNISFHELDFENSIERIQQDMSKALGVPYVLLKSGNNANINNNQVLFYLHTVIPMLDQFASAFSLRFNTVIKPDKRSISALRPDSKGHATYWATLVNSGIATVNEAREDLRLSKLDDTDCDEIRVPVNIAGSATNPSQGGRPPKEPDEGDNN